MQVRRLTLVLGLLLALSGVFGRTPPTSLATTAKLDAALLQQLNSAARAPALIVLSQQADTRWTATLPTKQAKGRAVVAALRAQADRDQPALVAVLADRGISVQRFLSVNALAAEIDLATAHMLAARPDVARIVADPSVQRVEPVATTNKSRAAPTQIEWNIKYVNAPQVWALGYTGQGIVVAGEDTGVYWNHAALQQRYRGWNGTTADHNYNWHDAIRSDIGAGNDNVCGRPSATPCDDFSHGTHTIGSIVGVDGTYNIGVAPGATWIACRNMDNGDGNAATYIECIDWMLAPYPLGGTIAQGDPDRAPDIINNSWGCPPSEGCSATPADLIGQSILNVVNAGILFVASAGNAGPGCGTVKDPPAIYPESFTVGAHNASGTIAGFSSRGPVAYNGTTRIGPDLTAPGVDVVSAINSDNGYASAQGTSMAAPHVAGVAALLWSARPELRGQVALTRRIVQETATPTTASVSCGGMLGSSIPNNTYGYGKVNALAAIQTTLQGNITVNGAPATGATLTITAPTLQLVSTTGAYSTTLPTGTYTVTAQVAGFAPQSATVSVASGTVTTQDFAFVGGSLQGSVSVNGKPAQSAVTLRFSSDALTFTLPVTSTYQQMLQSGTYTVTAELNGLPLQRTQVTITNGVTSTRSFQLTVYWSYLPFLVRD